MSEKECKKHIFIANTIEEVKTIFDPYRLKILKTLHGENTEKTVKQIAVELGEAPNKVHYHVKKLVDFGALELIKTENINGIIAKYYSTAYEGFIIGNEGNSEETISVKGNVLSAALDEVVSKFKVDMFTYMNLVAEQGKEAQRGLEINYEKLYMTKEEKEQYNKEIKKLISKYMKEDKDKEVYTTIQTLTRIK